MDLFSQDVSWRVGSDDVLSKVDSVPPSGGMNRPGFIGG